MAPASLTLPQVAALYGVSEASILLYEREGIVTPLRIDGERYYTAKSRTRIELALKGKKLGFSLSEIRRLIDAHLPASGEPFLGSSQLKCQIDQLEDEKDALQAAIDRLLTRMEAER